MWLRPLSRQRQTLKIMESPHTVMTPDGWYVLLRHYEECLARHGPTPLGADWPNGGDLATRFGVMLDLLGDVEQKPVLLDLGCGPGLLLDYLAATGVIENVDYRGIDLSATMIDAARARWPHHDFSCRDIVAAPLPDQSVDVVIMNGVLTERVSVGVKSMAE